MSVTPIFLISLPRSGSTLLQKNLMVHPSIASHSEPWFLLPLIYGMKSKGIKTEYGQKSATIALGHLYESLGSKSKYKGEVKKFALNMYKYLSEDKVQFFLDKTPRYFYILEDLIDIFPEAKFIVLLRNPVSVFASNIEAFSGNSIRRLDHLDNDFKKGPEKIARFLDLHGNKNNVLSITYENLTSSPESSLKKVCQFLGVDFVPEMVTDFSSQSLEGYGDHLGAKRFKVIKKDESKWKKIIDSRLRKKELLSYLEHYSDRYLEHAAFSKKSLIEEVQLYKPHKFLLREYFFWFEMVVIRFIKNILKYKTIS